MQTRKSLLPVPSAESLFRVILLWYFAVCVIALVALALIEYLLM